MYPLTVNLHDLDAWLAHAPGAAGGNSGLPPDLAPVQEPRMTPEGLLTGLLVSALEPVLGEIERLGSAPVRDDLQFDGRPRPAQRQLYAWLYAPDRRIACAVHTPRWEPPQGKPPQGEPPRVRADRPEARRNWDALLHEHFHAHFHSGPGWTTVGSVAMPLRVPFDEPGLKISPVLALWAPVSAGEHYLSETMTASIRNGLPKVVAVQVFSAELYVRALLASGRSTVDVAAHHGAASLQS